MLRGLVAFVQAVAWVVAAVLLLIFVAGHALTDRFLLTQYLFWIPSILLVPACVVTSAVACGLARLCAAKGSRRRRLAGLVLWGSVLGALYLFLADWRLYRVLTARASAPPERILHLIHWNMSSPRPEVWPLFLSAIHTDPLPDILLLTDPIWSADLAQLPRSLGPAYQIVRPGPLAFASRFPILETGGVSLDLPMRDAIAPARLDASAPFTPNPDDLIPGNRPSHPDPGFVEFARIDTTAVLGRPIVVWIVDLPSDPRLPRFYLTQLAARRLASLMGPTGRGEPPRAGLPPPDLIAGDFNIPRGSASLSALTRGMTHAFDQVGCGYVASWPRDWPIYHIDHVFLGPWLRALEYRVVNGGASDHRMQVFSVTADGAMRQ